VIIFIILKAKIIQWLALDVIYCLLNDKIQIIMKNENAISSA
jgi:hypothetical protein